MLVFARRLLLLAIVLVAGASMTTPARRAAAASPVPVPPQHEFVALADRPVCNLLQGDANVRGQDGASSVLANGRVFWGFGDTYVNQNSGGPNVGNSLGYTNAPSSDPAADCVAMQHKRDGSGNAIALFPKQAGECGLWPLGMSALQAPLVHYFYVSVTNCGNYTTNGIGLATFDGSQVPGFPAARKGIVWPSSGQTSVVEGAQTFLGGPNDGYLYIGLQGPTADGANQPFAKTVRIARVPASAGEVEACVPESSAACNMEYWSPSSQSWQPTVGSSGVAFNALLGTNGGVMFGYNGALSEWMATYATGPLFVVRARTSPSPSSAWSADEPLLSYCAYFLLPGQGYCYTGYIHPEYETNGGNTIYVTMATQRIPNGNIDLYSVLLHEITLGRPVTQSVNGNARRYAIGAPPAGFTPEGAAFYESAVPTPGFVPVYEWSDPGNGDVIMGWRQPDATHTSRGTLLFYAPPRVSVSNYADAYEPVYRWDKSPTEHVYSALSTLTAQGYTNAGIAFYTLCGDTDKDYLSDCAEMNSGNDPLVANGNVDNDLLLDDQGNPIPNAFGFPIPLGNMQSVAEDNGVRRQDIDNCPLVNNPWQENTDSGDIATGTATPDVTRPNSDILGDACDPDKDNDGLTNAEESVGCNGFGPTNPLKADTDGDHILDGFECRAGSNPNDAASKPVPPTLAQDTDHDGLSNALEAVYGTDPNNPDTDGDGLSDLVEVKFWGTDPLAADTDGDGCGDAREASSVDANWVVNSSDLLAIAQRFGSDQAYASFDVNRDGHINSSDLLQAAKSFGSCVPPRHIDRKLAQ